MKHHTLISVYLLLASLAGIIGVTVGLGNFAYQYATLAIISDQEYLAGHTDDWRLTQCQDPNNKSFAPATTTTGTGTLPPPTAEEIATCETKAHTLMVESRHFQAKESAISGGIWGVVFLILFLFHFPFFIRSRHAD